ncbi:MAG: hypothetical protein EOO54_12700 [Haliea sp.]|nr:MAG: hypothetical protein EOO54_12700 [Haliea sp.]
MLFPLAARADEANAGLATLWEVLWHQSGTPTRVVRWESDIRVRLSGVQLAAHRELTLKALREVTSEAGVKLIDVTEQPDARQVANLHVEIVADTALEDNQPCATSLDFKTETRIDSATIQMRARDAWRCAYHEAMHMMGVRGHPAGKTVLSYFPWKVDGLLPLDRVMLRAWYAPRMKPGMTPFEALPVLADELINTLPDRVAGAQARDLFFATTIEQMRAYANGQGDIPVVVKRSGKATEDGVRHGRTEMSFFLGVAYQDGVTVAPDLSQAQRWFERAASAGNRRAQARLGAFR